MTVQANSARSKRRVLAAPGGAHDRWIAFLIKALPAGIGLIAGALILVPLAQRKEVNLILDRKRSRSPIAGSRSAMLCTVAGMIAAGRFH